jgi:NAD(P)-dependent dehydrogenase (short-subunit alcohol dehydrogenase family)
MGNRVNTVAPGPTVTDLSAGSRLLQEQLTAQYPDQRPGTADEVAAAVVILASDDASHIHGSRPWPGHGPYFRVPVIGTYDPFRHA